MSSVQRLDQFGNNRCRRAAAAVPDDGQRLSSAVIRGQKLLNVKRFYVLRRLFARARSKIGGGNPRAQSLNVRAAKQPSVQHKLESVVFFGIVRRGYHNAAIGLSRARRKIKRGSRTNADVDNGQTAACQPVRQRTPQRIGRKTPVARDINFTFARFNQNRAESFADCKGVPVCQRPPRNAADVRGAQDGAIKSIR